MDELLQQYRLTVTVSRAFDGCFKVKIMGKLLRHEKKGQKLADAWLPVTTRVDETLALAMNIVKGILLDFEMAVTMEYTKVYIITESGHPLVHFRSKQKAETHLAFLEKHNTDRLTYTIITEEFGD